MNPEELWHAWAAGLIDGEGAVMLQKGTAVRGAAKVLTTQVSIHLRVAMTCRAPLDRLAIMYGGTVREVKDGRIFQWQLYGTTALSALRKMRPYMMVKGAHVDLCEEFYDTCAGKQLDSEVRLAYVDRMSTLQIKRGNAKA